MPNQAKTASSEQQIQRGRASILADAALCLSRQDVQKLAPEAASIAAEITALLHQTLATRAKQSAAPRAGGGRPPAGFVVVASGMGACLVRGAAPCAAYVEQLTAQLGQPVSLNGNTMQAALSRSGEWSRRIGSDFGEMNISVTRATAEQEAAWEADEAAGVAEPIRVPTAKVTGKKLAR